VNAAASRFRGKIEMQFLSDVFIRCPDCNGRRYRPHVLEVKSTHERDKKSGARCHQRPSRVGLDDACLRPLSIAIFSIQRSKKPSISSPGLPNPAQRNARAPASLCWRRFGLGYLKLGHRSYSVRRRKASVLKLSRHLAEWLAEKIGNPPSRSIGARGQLIEAPPAQPHLLFPLYSFSTSQPPVCTLMTSAG